MAKSNNFGLKESGKPRGDDRRTHQPLHRTLDGWAVSILRDAHAIRECEEHGWAKDLTDPRALAHARSAAVDHPFVGASSDDCIDAINRVMASMGDTCPDCE